MTQPSPDPGPGGIAVLLLGASHYPHFSGGRRLDNPAFARSAAAFRTLITEPATMGGRPVAVLDLFDSDEDAVQLIRRMKQFLDTQPKDADVLIYYCGHGSFLRDAQKTFVLTLSATEPENEGFTALPLRHMRLSLDGQLALRRVFLILDCCYSGRAATEWQSDAVGHVIEAQVFEAFPRRGTAMMAASSRGAPALAPAGAQLTMFSEALVETITNGIAGQGHWLSFRDVFAGTRQLIRERHGTEAAIPEIHAPYQPDGDISFDPLFINSAFARDDQPGPSERDAFEAARTDLESPLPRTRQAAVATIEELHAASRSTRFRADLLAVLRDVHDGDDSKAVRAAAAAVVEHAGVSTTEPAEIALTPAGKPAAPSQAEAPDVPHWLQAAIVPARRRPWVAAGALAAALILGALLWDAFDPTIVRGNTARLLRNAGFDVGYQADWPEIGTSLWAGITGTRTTLRGGLLDQNGAVEWRRGREGEPDIVASARFLHNRNLVFEVTFDRTQNSPADATFTVSYRIDPPSSEPSGAAPRDPIRVGGISSTDDRGAPGTLLHGSSLGQNAFRLGGSQEETFFNWPLLTGGRWLKVHFLVQSTDAVLTLERNEDALRLWTEVLSAPAP
jgi:hypothetical protein